MDNTFTVLHEYDVEEFTEHINSIINDTDLKEVPDSSSATRYEERNSNRDNHLYKETMKAGEITTLKTLSCTLNVYQKYKYLQCGRRLRW